MSEIKNGKLNIEQLEKLIYKNLGKKRDEIITDSYVGQDCGYIDMGEYIVSITTDPITATTSQIGKLAVVINLNDIASSQTHPFGIMVTILAPTGTTEEEIKDIMQCISLECSKNNVQIIGGHTEVTEAVNKIVVSITALGKIKKEKFQKIKQVKPGDKIYMSKEISLEGSMIICKEKKEQLKNILSQDEFNEVEKFIEKLSVLSEANILENYNISMMHDVTEGGIFGAIYELMKNINMGCIIKKENIKINKITEKICKFYNIDPFRLISSGCMIFITSDVIPTHIKEIEFTLIGEITKEKNVIFESKNNKYLMEPPESDELYKVI